MSDIKPFKISVPDAAIKRLRDKLELTDWPDEVDFSNDGNYGAPLDEVKRLANRWKDGFDWRAHEKKFNEIPQFTTTISVEGFDDLQIHFVHQRSSNPNSIPLLFCHGWPGHFLEVSKLLPLLTGSTGGDGNTPTFHVVAPSLPNFGFSSAVRTPGFAIPQYAEVCHGLMRRLGYERYATQGGDWGFSITRMMGAMYPAHCLASHLNYVRVAERPAGVAEDSPLEDWERAGLERSRWFKTEGFAYYLEHSTKPATVGFVLRDSPVALLAWVYEKLRDWTDGYAWDDDEVLAWVSVYRFATAGPEASVRIYYEHVHGSQAAETAARQIEYNGKVKLGLSWFPRDVMVPPRAWGRTLGDVVFESVHDRGGHFAAWEKPEALADDLRRMFGQGGVPRPVVERLARSGALLPEDDTDRPRKE